jgi:tRNA modification GTPase
MGQHDQSPDLSETIAAIATPPGTGGIGIVRVSGPSAFDVGRAIFRAARTSTVDDAMPPSHLLTYGHVVEPASGERVDEVLAAFMRAPHTYTREDVVELQAHGGPFVLRRILALALAAGARHAHPGEMTLRAFLNGRLDLAQAEGVMALIQAESEAGMRLALRQLSGDLSRRIQDVRGPAMEALVRIEAGIDFPEEEVPPPERAELAELVATARGRARALLAGAERGRLLREGLRVAIIGRPNVGKSSLLNALLGTERAIVTPVAGTTRDTVEERATIGGVAVHLVDTAGLTESDDPIERIGVERSRAAARQADLALFALDGSSTLTEADFAVAEDLRGCGFGSGSESERGRPVMLVVNKADLPTAFGDEAAAALWQGAAVVRTSTVAPGGVTALEEAIAGSVAEGEARGADPLVASARHRDALRRAAESLEAAAEALAGGIPLDFTALDLRAAIEALGEITGETATTDLLDRIFAEFCIGK